MDLRLFHCPNCHTVMAVEADVADKQDTLTCPRCEEEIDVEEDLFRGW